MGSCTDSIGQTLVQRLDSMADGWLCESLPDADLPREAAREMEPLQGLLGTTHADFLRECGDTDSVLDVLGFDPVNCRTDGGSLKLVMLLGAIEHRDVMTRRAARKAERERCAALCNTVAQNTTAPQRRRCAEDLAQAIREDLP